MIKRLLKMKTSKIIVMFLISALVFCISLILFKSLEINTKTLIPLVILLIAIVSTAGYISFGIAFIISLIVEYFENRYCLKIIKSKLSNKYQIVTMKKEIPELVVLTQNHNAILKARIDQNNIIYLIVYTPSKVIEGYTTEEYYKFLDYFSF